MVDRFVDIDGIAGSVKRFIKGA